MAAKLFLLIWSNLIFYLIVILIVSHITHTKCKTCFKYFLYGGLTIFPIIMALYFNIISHHQIISNTSIIIFYLAIAGIEELHKSLPFLRQKSFHISTYICVGLGFAAIENISYVWGLQNLSEVYMINGIRLFLTSSAHIVSCIMLGIFYFLSRQYWTTKHISFKYYGFGLIIAILFHGTFNLLQFWNLHFLTIPFLSLGIMGIYHMLPMIKLNPSKKTLIRT